MKRGDHLLPLFLPKVWVWVWVGVGVGFRGSGGLAVATESIAQRQLHALASYSTCKSMLSIKSIVGNTKHHSASIIDVLIVERKNAHPALLCTTPNTIFNAHAPFSPTSPGSRSASHETQFLC